MKNTKTLLAICLGSVMTLTASAIEYKGVEFPNGAISFADAVTDYSPVIVNGRPEAQFRDATEALGIPDFEEGPNRDYVTLGSGGSLTLQFVDNRLTGSGNADADLWIFEIGPDLEDTFVEISKDGLVWFPVGTTSGGTGGVDIDAFGFGPGDLFAYVRLTDDPNEGGTLGLTPGADIDAVGAITTVRVPDAGATLALLSMGCVLIGLGRKSIARLTA